MSKEKLPAFYYQREKNHRGAKPQNPLFLLISQLLRHKVLSANLLEHLNKRHSSIYPRAQGGIFPRI